MKVTVPHNLTIEEAIVILDRSITEIFASGNSVDLIERKRIWQGPQMEFALTAKVGFVQLPVAGKVLIDETTVTVNCELPPLIKTFVGEANLQASVDKKLRAILAKKRRAS